MSATRLEELASLVAIGAANGAEKTELNELVTGNLDAASELAAWEAVSGTFAESLDPVEPPVGGLASLRAAITDDGKATLVGMPASLVTTEQVSIPEYAKAGPSSDGKVIVLAERRRKRMFATGFGVALAAAAAFLFLWMSERNKTKATERDLASVSEKRDADIDAVRKDAQVEIERLAGALERSSTQIKTLAARFEPLRAAKLEYAKMSSDGGGFAHVFADGESKKWLLVANSLPSLASDQDYQMWLVPESGKPVSAGLLRPGAEGLMTATIEVPARLSGTKLRPAISLEPRGGSAQPTVVKLIGEPI